jgi:integrase
MTTTWSVKITDGDKRREVSTGETDYDLAVAWVHRRISGQPEPVAITPPKPIQDVLKSYLDDLASRAGASHVRDVAKRLDTLRQDLKWATVSDLVQIRSSINLWSRQQVDRQVRSVRTVNCYTSAAKAFATFLNDTIDSDIKINGIKVYSESASPRRPRRALSPEQYLRFIEVVRLQVPHGPSRAVVYEIATRTGLRKNEIRQLDASQIHLGPNPSIQLKAGATKNKKADLLPIDQSLADTLSKYLRGRDRGLVCPTMPTMRTFNLDLQRAGIPKVDQNGQTIDFHSLRKSFVTWLLAGGADARTVQALARHSSITLTTSTYTDVSQLPTRKALDALPYVDRMRTNS